MNIDLEELDSPNLFLSREENTRTEEENEQRIEGKLDKRYRRTGATQQLFIQRRIDTIGANSYRSPDHPKTNVS